ncbi:MAG TPA: XRE family transcriptional regulator [Actinomycetota bacterium]|nr:XRE family transcriptional regulator [Actinomycetota bacterium]
MAITQEELARRLKEARLNVGLTQQDAADELGIARTAIVQIEAGRRAVNSLELARLARLYGRGADEFLQEETPEVDPLSVLFRASGGLEQSSTLSGALRRCANLSRTAKQLETMLDLDSVRSLSVLYDNAAPSNRWDAVRQGRALAEAERNRLNLGSAPVLEVADVIRRQGVRVTELEMPDDVSGLFFQGPGVGFVIVVNETHSRTRRLFSYGHEYCHALADRDRSATISRAANRDELIEVRANSFAAHFLMPERGVRAFIQSLGKGEPSRQVQEIFDGFGETTAERRHPPGSQDLQVHDIVAMAHHFGVSFLAALYHLLNLKLVSNAQFETLKKQETAAGATARALRIDNRDEDIHWSLSEQVLSLALEAYLRGEISRRKLSELADDAGVPASQIEMIVSPDDTAEESSEILLPQ